MPNAGKGHIERLPSGSYRVGQQPEWAATVGYLLDQYMAVADLDVSTREGYEGHIRRTIKPALGGMELRKLRGPVLDTFCARLRQCGDLACTGKPFTEHRNVPVLTVDPGDSRPAYRQIADTLAKMIRSGQLRVGVRLPSVREMSDGGVPTASARNALAVLTEEGLITSRQGSGAFVASRCQLAQFGRSMPSCPALSSPQCGGSGLAATPLRRRSCPEQAPASRRPLPQPGSEGHRRRAGRASGTRDLPVAGGRYRCAPRRAVQAVVGGS
jgi:hypothetical protein